VHVVTEAVMLGQILLNLGIISFEFKVFMVSKFYMLLKVQIYDSQSQENILVINQRINDRLHHCVNVEFS